MNGTHRLFVILTLVVVVAACNTEFKKDLDGGEDAIDVSGDTVVDGAPDVEPDGGRDCGNGDVDDGEQCDDGNDVNGDGCDNDCTYSCQEDGDCQDDNPCNGEELCNGEEHVCVEGTAREDGFLLDVGPPRIICLDGNPAESECGDGFVDEGAGEFCEPPGVGACTEDCVLGCTSDGDCPDDGQLCNGEEYCNEGLCDRRDVPSEGTECNDGLFCTTGDACDGAGTCVGLDPTCDDDLTCTDNRCDETADVCQYPLISGNCLMDGTCYADHDLNPSNDCEECDSAREISIWVPLADGAACADEGVSCTDDVCASGACDHPVTSGWCLIGGACISDTTRDSGNECLVCDSSVDRRDWTIDVGYGCDDGDSCTTGDACDSTGACVGTPSSSFSGVDQIEAGMYHTCALQADAMSCWGYNISGQLGNGSTASSWSPVTPTGMGSGVASVSAGTYHTCAVRTDGTVRCWGGNSEGQLGNGTNTDSHVPVTVTGITNATQVSTGMYHTCVRLSSGQVRCWGRGSYGELGNGSATGSNTPVAVLDTSGYANLGGVLAVECGNYHNCALLGAGTMACWGFNSHGNSGADPTLPSTLTHPYYTWTSASDSSPLDNIAQISLGGNHTCALMDTGMAKCWGYNSMGQIGNGTTTTPIENPVNVLVSVSPSVLLTGVVEIRGGSQHTCARDSSGFVLCWGQGDEGQLGNGNDGSGYHETLPQLVKRDSSGVFLSGTSALSLGALHTTAIAYTSDNVLGWGRNNYGQLGIGSYATPQLYPVMVGCP